MSLFLSGTGWGGDTLIPVLVGALFLVFGYLIGVRQKINLVHSYHYKRVAEQDKPVFCKRVGLGNAIIGGAILAVPVLRPLIGEAALVIAAVAAVAAGVLVFTTIIKYNQGLF